MKTPQVIDDIPPIENLKKKSFFTTCQNYNSAEKWIKMHFENEFPHKECCPKMEHLINAVVVTVVPLKEGTLVVLGTLNRIGFKHSLVFFEHLLRKKKRDRIQTAMEELLTCRRVIKIDASKKPQSTLHAGDSRFVMTPYLPFSKIPFEGSLKAKAKLNFRGEVKAQAIMASYFTFLHFGQLDVAGFNHGIWTQENRAFVTELVFAETKEKEKKAIALNATKPPLPKLKSDDSLDWRTKDVEKFPNLQSEIETKTLQTKEQKEKQIEIQRTPDDINALLEGQVRLKTEENAKLTEKQLFESKPTEMQKATSDLFF